MGIGRGRLIAGLRLNGLTAPMAVDGAMDGEMFTAYAETIPAPTLSEGGIVILDNLPAHKVSGAIPAIAHTHTSPARKLPFHGL